MKASLLSHTMQPLGKANKPGVRGDGGKAGGQLHKINNSTPRPRPVL